MIDFERPILIGVVFDISSFYYNDGKQKIDLVKESLFDFLNKEISAKIYVSVPELTKMPRDQGESTYNIVTYKEPTKFSIDDAFKRAVTVIGECAEDGDKYVFLFTDRFNAPNSFHYRKSLLANGIRGYDTKICIFGLGVNYDKLTLQSLSKEYEVYFTHVPEINLLTESFVGALKGK